MDACWWCIWYHLCFFCIDCPHRTVVSPLGWCEGFSPCFDWNYDTRARQYAIPEDAT